MLQTSERMYQINCNEKLLYILGIEWMTLERTEEKMVQELMMNMQGVWDD